GLSQAPRRNSGGKTHTSSGSKTAVPSRRTTMTLLWPWAKLEWRAVCAERCTYGSGRRSASALLTPLATWQGFVYVAFVIDAFARRIVGWRVSRTAHASFVLDALEQALHDRRPVHDGGLVHHSDRGVQYVSIRYSERLTEAGIEPSVGSVGDSYDNALAETINGLYKAEVIHRRGPWRNFESVEFATLEWVDWFNHRRLLEPIGNIPPAEAEEQYYAALDQPAVAA
ncbi:IS3 family transposase, partial [Labrenzia sp. OB1]|uniref:IS3 family transposase n=1 Tax=Labrenzia sp. OB1 TaxID=1561204 RepID=UPI000A4FB300